MIEAEPTVSVSQIVNLRVNMALQQTDRYAR